MQAIVERAAIQHTENFVRALIVALSELQVYGASHPRYAKAVDDGLKVLKSIFELFQDSKRLTLTFDRDQVEFQGIPLMNLGAQSERILALFQAEGCKGVQLKPEMGPEDFSALLAGILNWSRPKTANSEGAAAADAADADGAGRAFHFIQKRSREAAALGITTAAMETDEEESPVDDGGIAAAVPSLKVSTATFRSVLATYKSLLASLQAGRVPDLEALRKTTDQVVQTFAGGPKAPLPNSFHHYFDDFTFHHSTNVCLIITSLAANLSTDQELINRISIAALVHDIGKSKVPAEILHKPGKLTESEFDVLRQHPVEGAKMLLGIDGVDPLSVGVAYCHHINLDASSYPRTRKVMPLNWVTDLITVVDVYEALVSHRPYKRGLSTKTALEIMLTMPGLKNRHELIHILYHNLGPYPTGTLVELNTGERAIVVDQNLSSPFLPKVRVLTDPDRNPIDQPRDLDLSLHLPGGILNDPVKIARAVVVQSRDEDPLKADLCPEPRDILGAPLADDGALMSREG